MTELAIGTRMRSAVCTTEAIVVAAPAGDVTLTCGGVPMIALDDEVPAGATPDPDAMGGTLLGKRYTNDAGTIEILCTKPGEGSIGLDGEVLVQKDAKPLPSSD